MGRVLQNINSVIILFLYFDLNLGKFHVPSWSKVELLMVYTSQFVMWFHQHIPYFITLTLKPGQRKWNKNEKDYINRKLTEIEQIPHHRLWLGTAAEENNKIFDVIINFLTTDEIRLNQIDAEDPEVRTWSNSQFLRRKEKKKIDP